MTWTKRRFFLTLSLMYVPEAYGTVESSASAALPQGTEVRLSTGLSADPVVVTGDWASRLRALEDEVRALRTRLDAASGTRQEEQN